LASGATSFELGWAHDSGEHSSRKYPDILKIKVLLEEAEIDDDTVQELAESAAQRGFGEIPEWWLLDEQAAKLGIRVRRPQVLSS
jgi:hypothetical protein